ncbi:MAG: hypothetical protein KAX49_07330 [Halanaerobiales bacterium]|nr:hypothetical protein [Halanaerobiales bacterium]
MGRSSKIRKEKQKALDIPKEVREVVYERDGGCCIICGAHGAPNSHYISKGNNGMGIEENIVTHCLKCHHDYDNGNDTARRNYIKEKTKEYLQSHYPDWNEEKLIWRRF